MALNSGQHVVQVGPGTLMEKTFGGPGAKIEVWLSPGAVSVFSCIYIIIFLHAALNVAAHVEFNTLYSLTLSHERVQNKTES